MEENKYIGEISDFDFKGFGMTKLNGKPVFLDAGVIGDEVEFVLTKNKKISQKGKLQKL
ncbi:hypothetical protein [Peptoniphilus timonensis]|uniref:hypothetical protein n=1 Tax=Peptoniphilus timonensis TaxID=1268254 RepID=UPI000305923A|nr:hypothetical protein [Peptoniphilus timonensis]